MEDTLLSPVTNPQPPRHPFLHKETQRVLEGFEAFTYPKTCQERPTIFFRRAGIGLTRKRLILSHGHFSLRVSPVHTRQVTRDFREPRHDRPLPYVAPQSVWVGLSESGIPSPGSPSITPSDLPLLVPAAP